MNESSLAAKRRSRRVPEEARKRNTLSCDWCRKRRCKCVPSQSGKGCLPCEKNNQPCSYTSPRKTRFYGSVDELSDRYRCLEAIVKGAFPNEETATAAELYELGIKKGYRMPDLSDNDRPAVKIEELVRVPSGSVPPPLSQQQSRDSSTTATGSTSPHPHNIHNDNININRSSSSSSIANIINNPPPLPPPHSHPHPHPATALTTTDRHHAARGSSQERHTQEGWRPRTRASSDEPRDSLIRDNQGNSHFIGCSGTLSFLSQLRRLVDTSAPSQEAQVAAKSKFTQDNTAQALEADDDPPAALEKDDNPDACPPSSPPPPRDPMAMVVDRVPPSRGLPTHQNYPPQQQQAVADSPESMSSATARDFTRLPAEEMDEMLRQLPADDVLEALIASYFKNVHDDFPLFHRATFQEEFEMYIVRRPSRQQHDKAPAPVGQQQPSPTPDWGWIGCLQMVCVFGSISDPKIAVDHAALRRRSVTATRTLLPQFISKCSLTNVRVLMLLSLFLHNNNERNAAWNLVGTSTRLAFALGLHRPEMMASFRPLEREVRKWVFCTLYAFEQFLASSLGRPSGLQEMDVEIVPPREGFLDNGGGTDAKLVALSLRLQGILSRTRLMHLGRRHNSVEDILAALDEWKADIAQNPGYDLPWVKTEGFDEPKTVAFAELKASLAWKTRAQLRAVLLVHINYHYITLVATRGVLLRDISMMRRGETVPYSSASEACVKNACQLAHMVILLDTFDILNGLSGLDVFYGYCAAMVLILRLMRPTPGPAPSPGHRDDNSGIAAQQSEKLVQSSLRSLVAKVQDVINRAEKGGSMRRFARVVDTFFNVIKKPPTARIPSIAAPSSTPSHQGLQRYQGHPQGHYQPPPLPPGQHHMPMPPHQQYPHQQQQMQYYQGQNFGGSGASGPGFGYNPNAPPPEHHGMAAPAPPQFGQGYGGDWFNFLPLSTFGNAGVTEFPFSHENNGDYADMEVILGSFRGYNG